MSADIPPPDPRSAGLLHIHSFAPNDGASAVNGSPMVTVPGATFAPGAWMLGGAGLVAPRGQRGDLPHFPVDALGPSAAPWLDRAAKGAGATRCSCCCAAARDRLGPDRGRTPSQSLGFLVRAILALDRTCGLFGHGENAWAGGQPSPPGCHRKMRKESMDELRREHEQRAAVG